MEPIFDRDGNVVGWIRPPGTIVDNHGNYRAFISDEAIFDYRTRYLGRLHNGYLWDQDGNAVASIVGASDGPVLERKGIIPQPPVAGPEPARPSPPPVPGQIPAYSKKWSEISWDEFLSGRQVFIAYRS
ncbi:MAG: hypothetical protein A4E28_02024 [Methanocella sp. PtaU1.Bin125]|nr:MAG: hypothetical protein A4E28_02024 [Methanocella sp. PtaU1.Bin125]